MHSCASAGAVALIIIVFRSTVEQDENAMMLIQASSCVVNGDVRYIPASLLAFTGSLPWSSSTTAFLSFNSGARSDELGPQFRKQRLDGQPRIYIDAGLVTHYFSNVLLFQTVTVARR